MDGEEVTGTERDIQPIIIAKSIVMLFIYRSS